MYSLTTEDLELRSSDEKEHVIFVLLVWAILCYMILPSSIHLPEISLLSFFTAEQYSGVYIYHIFIIHYPGQERYLLSHVHCYGIHNSNVLPTEPSFQSYSLYFLESSFYCWEDSCHKLYYLNVQVPILIVKTLHLTDQIEYLCCNIQLVTL